MTAPWEEDRFKFTGPNVAISCTVEYDKERHVYVASSREGYRGESSESDDAAALACFEAWVTTRVSYHVPSERS